MSVKCKNNIWSGTARRVRCFLKEEQAVEAGEYAFMLGLMIVGLVGVISLLGEAELNIWASVDTTLTEATDQYL